MERPVRDWEGEYTRGMATFGRMIARWMDGNGWSHPTMARLATCALDGTGWLHNSTINTLRNAQARNPGPRSFQAIARLNECLWRYHQHKELIPGTTSSNDYAHAVPIVVDGQPPSPGWFFEVFLGLITPEGLEANLPLIAENKADEFSKYLGRLMRQLLAQAGYDVVDDLGDLIKDTYSATDRMRSARITRLIQGQTTLTADQLQQELPLLAEISARLDGPSDVNTLLNEVFTRVRQK